MFACTTTPGNGTYKPPRKDLPSLQPSLSANDRQWATVVPQQHGRKQQASQHDGEPPGPSTDYESQQPAWQLDPTTSTADSASSPT